VVAGVFTLFHLLDDFAGGGIVHLDPEFLGEAEDRTLAGQFADHDLAFVADEGRVEMLEGPRVGLDAGDMQAALVGERVAANVRL